jgi:putative transposase
MIKKMRPLVLKHPRYGYRRVAALLRRQGQPGNPKRVFRIWQQQGWSLPRRRKRKRRGPSEPRPMLATRPNEVWAYDFVFDNCANGEKLKCLGIIDEFTRECVALVADGSIKARRVIEVVQLAMKQYGTPAYLRSDNGPEFIAKTIRGWLEKAGIDTAYIDPGKPWQNGNAESFFDKFRTECLNTEWFHSRKEAQVVIEQFRLAGTHYLGHRV